MIALSVFGAFQGPATATTAPSRAGASPMMSKVKRNPGIEKLQV